MTTAKGLTSGYVPMHLDEPALFRFLRWVVGLLQGDLGTSYANEMPVTALIAGRFVNTLKLAGVTALFSVPIALTLGITSAMIVWYSSIPAVTNFKR